MKIVLNKDYGGFCLSREAYEFLGWGWDGYGFGPLHQPDKKWRADPKLVECVEKLGKRANGRFAWLEVVEIPDGIEFDILDYDGWEYAYEKGRLW